MTRKTLYMSKANFTAQDAQQRVLREELLRPYYATICEREFDQSELQTQINWVCNAPAREILAWAKGIRQDEQEEQKESV